MPGKLAGILQVVGRLGAATLGMLAATYFWKLPLAASVGAAQIVFYVSFVVVPLQLKRLLLLEELGTSLGTLAGTVVSLPCNQYGQSQVLIVVSDVLKIPEVEKVSKVTQLQKLIRARDRQFADLFFHDMIPVLLVVVMAGVFSIAIQKMPAQELLHMGINPQAPVISFTQGLISVVPVVWTLGKLYGEISFIRGRVFELLD